MFVLQDTVHNLPDLVKWHAALCGGVICGPDFVVRGRGVCHSYQAGLESTRLLWMTDAFVHAHPQVADATLYRTKVFVETDMSHNHLKPVYISTSIVIFIHLRFENRQLKTKTSATS